MSDIKLDKELRDSLERVVAKAWRRWALAGSVVGFFVSWRYGGRSIDEAAALSLCGYLIACGLIYSFRSMLAKW